MSGQLVGEREEPVSETVQPGDTTIEAHSDTDSALGDEESQYTVSLASTINRHITENGRRYHAYKDGSYALPNDDPELDRLDLTHQMIMEVMEGKLHLCPLDKDKPLRILDIGTGTGIWAIQMGDQYPLSEIIGTDLSPTQPIWVPLNVKFEVDDCEELWTFAKPFDFVHIRYMAFSIRSWETLARQSYANTAPGGWCEFQDFDLTYYSQDGSMSEDSPVARWIRMLLNACRIFGREPCPGPKLEGWLQDVGFENVKSNKSVVPIGPWPKDRYLKTIGTFNLVQIEEGLEAFTLRLYTQVLHWKAEEVQVLLAGVRKDLRNPKIHILFDFYVVYGQKPALPANADGGDREFLSG